MPVGAATTQPMGMPRPSAASQAGPHAMPAARAPGAPTRSTQRIVLPTATTTLVATKTTTLGSPTGRINLPIGMILRALPPEVLAADVAQFEASGAAATEIGLPMNLILGQLPSGKVEIPLAELVPHFPPGYLQPTQSIAGYLPTLVNLPLMDVVMRIPPDLLALRPDQKDVDAAVINMADPFTEEILREQAEAARRGSETNIIDESQVKPAEEFVPRDQQAPAAKSPPSFAPPPRPDGPPSLARPALSTATAPVAIRPGAMPPPPAPVRAASPVPPTPPAGPVRQVAPTLSGKLPVPPRSGSPLVRAASTAPVSLPQPPSFIIPPPTNPGLARPTAALPMAMPTPARPAPQPQAPQPPLRPPSAPLTPSVPILPASNSDTSQPEPAPAPTEKTPEPAIKPGEPDAAAGELQRLAALAMKAIADEEATAARSLRANAETVAVGAIAAAGVSQLLPAAPAPQPARQPELALETSPAPSEPTPAPAPTPPVHVSPPESRTPAPVPAAAQTPAPELEEVSAPSRPFGSKSITAPLPTLAETPAPESASPVSPVEETAPAPAGTPSIALNLNSCTAEELLQIPGCGKALAQAIVQQRAKIGSFRRVEDLLDVPGMNGAAYSALTGEEPPAAGISASVGELLGFPPDQKLSLKDVTERIGCWPDVNGCVLSQKSGLHLVGHVPKGFDRAAIVAFAPRMFEAVNRSFSEIASKETDELIIPTSGTSFHIFRSHDLYLIIMSRLPQMPDRHAKIARMVLGGLNPQPQPA